MAKKATAPAKASVDAPARGRSINLPAWAFPLILLVIVFVAYANTLGHDYALDDSIVITENKYTQKGFAGIGDIFSHESFVGYFGEDKSLVAGARYRPLSIATFAMEVGIFGKDQPGMSHFLNVVLFGLTCLLVYAFAARVLPSQGRWLPFLAAVIFAVHPIHTEAVANIKGRDEILALLFSAISLIALWDYLTKRAIWLLPIAAVSFLLALLAKESPLPLVAVAPFLLLLHPKREKVMNVLVPTAALLLAAALYLAIRINVTGLNLKPATDLLNNSYRDATGLERIGTVFYCLAYYVKLLFIPWPLTHDYYPYQIPLVNPWHPVALAGIAITGAMLWLGFKGVRNRQPYGWIMLFYLLTISIVSNLVLNVGVFMAERFLFLPSVSFCLIAAWLLMKGLERKRSLTMGALSVMLATFGLLTIVRNMAWKDNATLFLTDVNNSPNSAKARVAGAAESWKAAKEERNSMKRQKLLDDALEHINKAIEIYPTHALAWDFKGHILVERKQFAEAVKCYDEATRLVPESPLYLRNLGIGTNLAGQYAKSADAFNRYLQLYPNDAGAWYDLGLAYENNKEMDKALSAYHKSIQLNAGNSEALGKIGMIQGRHFQRPDSAIIYLDRAVKAGGRKEWIYNNLGIAYGLKQDYQNSAKVLEEGLKAFPQSREILSSLVVTYNAMGNAARAMELQQQLQQTNRP